ncbi:MAG: HD domain-containing protein [Candidatus Taylorbacteria bacterium]
MLDKVTMKKITNIGLETDWNQAFGAKSKGNRHLFRVVKLAVFMAKKLGANVPIVEAAAWLHDTALPSGNDYNYSSNKRIVLKILEELDLTKHEQNEIAECVASHEGTGKAKSLEARIVHDADVLEKSGILGIIRHTWKVSNQGNRGFIDDKTSDVILKHLQWRSKKLSTPLARQIYTYVSIPVSRKKAKEIIFFVAPKAIKGIVTEKIAESLLPKLSKMQKNRLKEQLAMTYLKRF